MSAIGVYLILFTTTNRHISSGVAIEHNSTMGKSVNDIHLCKNFRLGLSISLNLSLVDFLEIASLNSTLLKFLIALDSGKQDLEKSRNERDHNQVISRIDETSRTTFYPSQLFQKS
jgi:hypothetical protein